MMYAATVFILQLFLVVQFLMARPTPKMPTPKLRQTVASNFTLCTATCNGGFRVRSVRCLDEDSVIAHDCEDWVESYQFCNQINCTTGDSDPSLFPEAGTYNFTIDAVAYAVLRFVVYTPESYQVHLVVTESDLAQTWRNDTVTALHSSSMIHVSGVAGSLRFLETSEGSFLQSDGRNIMSVDNIDDLHFSDTDLLQYQNNTVYDSYGNSLLSNLSTLFFCDGYTMYEFNTHKKNPVHGWGVLFVNRGMRVAVYFATPNTTTPNLFTEAISYLEDAVHTDGSGREAPVSVDRNLLLDKPEEKEEGSHMDESPTASGDLSIDYQMEEQDSRTDGSARFVRSATEDPASGDSLLEEMVALPARNEGSGGM